MNDRDPKDPPHSGRRARPHGEDGMPSGAPLRAQAKAESSSPPARRAAGDRREDTSDTGTQWWLRRGWWAVAVALIALLSLVLSLVLRPSVGTPTAQRALPFSTAGQTSSSSAPSTVPSQTELEEDSNSPASVSPQDGAPPLPGTARPTPTITDQTQPAESEPTATIAAGDIELNDARFSAPTGWMISGDEQIENSRRAVRLNQQDTDIRLQAVTLEPSGQELGASCGSLVDFQQAQFTDVKRQLVVPVGVDAGRGSAVRCGFEGIRTSDGVTNTVTFTLVSRAVDSHVLMLRTTVPEQSAEESPVIAQLNAMTCATSTSFGVALPLC